MIDESEKYWPWFRDRRPFPSIDDNPNAYALHWNIAHEQYALSLCGSVSGLKCLPEPPHIQEALKERAEKLLFCFELLTFFKGSK